MEKMGMDKKAKKDKKETRSKKKVSSSTASVLETEVLRRELLRLQLENAHLSQYYHSAQLGHSSYSENAHTPSITVLQCPNECAVTNPNVKGIFLGGHIGNDDWQKTLIEKLKNHELNQSIQIFNPRKSEWKVAAERTLSQNPETVAIVNKQFSWELEYLEKSSCAVYNFVWEHTPMIGPFLQLGSFSSSQKPLFVCIHPRNKDKKTIYEFIKTTSSNAYVTSNIEKLGNSIVNWIITGRLPENNSQGSLSDDAASVYSGRM
jgi:Nucleoside 2-deoxyribosyltransferase like